MNNRTGVVGGHSCPLIVSEACGVLLQPVQGSLAYGIQLHLTMVHKVPEQAAVDMLRELGLMDHA